MPTMLQRVPRNLGTMTSQDLDRSPTGVALNRRPTPTGLPLAPGAAISSVPGQLPPVTGLQRTPPPAAAAPLDFNGLPPGSFGAQNVANNAGLYQPGSFGDQNARANGTGYRAPQQTERANPLSGDNNVPMESTTTRVPPAPFIQRGTSVPSGRDTIPAPIRDTATIDSDIQQSIDGTQNNLRGGPQPVTGGSGLYRRSFSNPSSAQRYGNFVQRLFGGAGDSAMG